MSEQAKDGLYVFQPFGIQDGKERWDEGRIFAIGGLPMFATVKGLTRAEADAILKALSPAPAEPQTPEPEITPVARAVLAVHEARQDILNFVSRYLDLDRAAAMTDALIAAVEARAKIDVDTMATLKAAWEKRAYEAEAALEPAAPVSPEAHLLTTEAAAFKAGWQERGVDDWSHPPAWGGVENALAAYRSSQAGSVNK